MPKLLNFSHHTLTNVSEPGNIENKIVGSPTESSSITIGLIADLHDHRPNLERWLTVATRARLTELWCAGDIGAPDTYVALLSRLPIPIRAVVGNLECDIGVRRYATLTQAEYQLIWYPREPSQFSFAGLSVELRHHPGPRAQTKTDATQVVVFGHTHAPSLAHDHGAWRVNPGTLSGWPNPATYALLTFDRGQPRFTLHRL